MKLPCSSGSGSAVERCPLHAQFDRGFEATEKAFAAVTIQEILDSTTSIIPLCESR